MLNQISVLRMINLFEFLTDWQKVEKLHGDNRPLCHDQRKVIDFNRHELAQLIDPKQDIIDRLYDSRCFNKLHKDHIECGENTFDKANRLLDIMRRRSVADVQKLAMVLHADGCTLLTEGGGKQSWRN